MKPVRLAPEALGELSEAAEWYEMRGRAGPRLAGYTGRRVCATLTHMQRIGVRQLQQNAAAAMRRVRRGERLEVTDRGRPVAVLAPAAPGNVLEALDAAGRVTRAEGDLLDLGAPIRLPARVERPSRRLARLRADER